MGFGFGFGFGKQATDHNDLLIGSHRDDEIDAKGGNDLVFARGGDDTVYGGAGDDRLFGDSLLGGWYHLHSWNCCWGPKPLWGWGFGHHFGWLKPLHGGDDTLYGNEGNDLLVGGGGDDLLDGGPGADAMYGGRGDDQYRVDDPGDLVIEQWCGGMDTVVSEIDYTLPDHVEKLVLADVVVGPLDSYATDFEDFSLGSIAGQNGWVLGSNKPEEIVDTGGAQGQAFLITNDPSSGDFAGPFGPQLGVTVGETGITSADTNSMTMSFKFKPVSEDPDGSRVEIDFGTADGTDRANFMALEFTADRGLRLVVSEPTDLSGSTEWTNDLGEPFNFSFEVGNRELANNIDPTQWHEIRLELTYVDGPNNDVIDVYLDGVHVGQTTTFENYFDYHVAADSHDVNAQNDVVNRIFFRNGEAAGNSFPQDGDGGERAGFLIDDVAYSAGEDIADLNGTGNGLDNMITGNGGDNVLSGLAGNDMIMGEAGDDSLIGGADDDQLDGGDGEDTAVFSGDFSDYIISYLGDGMIQIADSVADRDGTDSLVNIEWAEFADGVVELGPVMVFDAGNAFVGFFGTIQAGVDAASDGYTVLIAPGTYNESVDVTAAVDFVGAGAGKTIVTPPSGSAFVIDQDLGAGNSVSFTGLEFTGASRSGVQFSNAAVLGTLAIYNSHFEANAQNGVEVLTGGGLGNAIIENSRFVGNGEPSLSSGDGDILFYQFNGDALIKDVQITGQDRGAGEQENGIQFRSDSGAMGNVTLENVTIDGVFEKQGIAIFNYDDIDGLQMTNVDLSAMDSTGFNLSINIDGVGGNVDFSDTGKFANVTVPGSTDPVAIQGDDSAQTLVGRGGSEVLRGHGDSDLLIGKGGSDLLIGDAGNDLFKWLAGDADGSTDVVADLVIGDDALNLADILQGTPNAGNIGSYINAVSGTDTTLEVDVDGAGVFGASSELFIVLQGVNIANGDLDDLVTNGTLVVA